MKSNFFILIKIENLTTKQYVCLYFQPIFRLDIINSFVFITNMNPG